MAVRKPHIFEYDNYRKSLENTYLQSKTADPKFSLRYFATRAGYKSPSILLEIIKGKRNLSPDGIERFAQSLKLNQEEIHFFRHLVLLNQAETAEERLVHTREITKSRAYRKLHPL